jgi:hypothetical protein
VEGHGNSSEKGSDHPGKHRIAPPEKGSQHRKKAEENGGEQAATGERGTRHRKIFVEREAGPADDNHPKKLRCPQKEEKKPAGSHKNSWDHTAHRWLLRIELRTGLAESTLPAIKNSDRLHKLVPFEIRPFYFGKIEFGIGSLPEKKIGKAIFPTSPD